MMAGELDEISLAIGEMRADLRSLGRSLDQDREFADTRHRENQATLRDIDARVDDLDRKVAPLAATVSKIEPIVESYRISRWKLAGAVGLASAFLAVLGWVVSIGAGKAIAWIVSLVR